MMMMMMLMMMMSVNCASFCDSFPNVKCSNTPQGSLPDVHKMVSTLIASPEDGSTIQSNEALPITVSTINLATGFIQSPPLSIPQTLSSSGAIQGHIQISIQKVTGSVPDASFVFFKRLKGNTLTVGPGILNEGGLYRICTMIASATLQPVIMPVAQRGSQDDCVRVTVSNAGGAGSNTPVVEADG